MSPGLTEPQGAPGPPGPVPTGGPPTRLHDMSGSDLT